MDIFGFSLTRTKQAPLMPVDDRGTWLPWQIVKESFAGAWQHNVEVRPNDVLRFSIVFACVTLIAGDISKLWLRLMSVDENGIATEVENTAYSPVLRAPNHYQTTVEFIESWLFSKLIHGNTYVLLERNNRGGEENGNVIAMYVLDPGRVKTLVAPDGSVFYSLQQDLLSGVPETEIVVPSSEIIHDRNAPLHHPLVGLSPISACGLTAMQGLRAQTAAAAFIENGSQPGGILTIPTPITQTKADDLKRQWKANQGGVNRGDIALLTGGMTYTPIEIVSAHDAQLIEQLKMSAEDVARAFGMPLWKVGLGPMPAYGNVQAANIEYYAVALQNRIEKIEAGLGKGLDLAKPLDVQFDLTALLRMDSLTQMEIATKGVGAAIYKPNEARALFDLKPVPGGDTPFLQQQNWPLGELVNRPLPASAPTPPTPLPTKEIDYAAVRARVMTRVKELHVAA